MIKKIEPVISKEAERWEQSPQGVLACLQAAIDMGDIKPKEMIIVFYDRKDGKKVLRLEKAGAQLDRHIGMLELAKYKLCSE